MIQLIHRHRLLDHIGSAKNIVDVGCGNRPLHLATVAVDKVMDTFKAGGRTYLENPTGKVKTRGARFVEARLPDLPFKDQEFDFAYCTHVLAYVDDIEAGIRELTRIAPRGYLEIPRSWFEFANCTPFHKWLIDFDGEQLIIRPRTEQERNFSVRRRVYDASKRLYNQFYRCYEAELIDGLDSPHKFTRLNFLRILRPKTYPDLESQRVNKTLQAITLYWEKTIPYQMHKPFVYL